MITREELDFLRESNNIEDERSDLALQEAILAWEYLLEFDRLTEDLILETHKCLMFSRGTIKDEEKGSYRTDQVFVGTKEKKPWYAVPYLMENWIERANETVLRNSKVGKTSVAEQIIQDHVVYEDIHPFFDGNGRSGRIFYNWQRVKCGLDIDIIREKYMHSYYVWFAD